ncbi:hypothetical protein [Arthrobacter monumenti]
MTEQKPEDDLTIVGDDETGIPDQNVDAVPPEIVESDEDTVESEEVQPDSYPQAAENDPDHWRQDPLISGGAASDVTTEDELSDQTLRDETAEERYRAGDEQIAPEEPTIGEAAGDVDFGDALEEEEMDGSDDPANAGGRPLSGYNTGDPEQ